MTNSQEKRSKQDSIFGAAEAKISLTECHEHSVVTVQQCQTCYYILSESLQALCGLALR